MNSTSNSKPPRWDAHAERRRPRRKLVQRAYEKEYARRQRLAGGPKFWITPPDEWHYQEVSPLLTVQDDFVGHPVTDRTVICRDIYHEEEFAEKVLPVIKAIRAHPQNRGLQVEGMALTFRTREDAAKFRLFYDGDTTTQ